MLGTRRPVSKDVTLLQIHSRGDVVLLLSFK